MDVRDFDFDLPSELIAQEPAADRGGARLLYVERATGELVHSTVSALPGFLAPGDLVVVNNTRVFPARLLGHRDPSGGAVECLLIRRLDNEAPAAPVVSAAPAAPVPPAAPVAPAAPAAPVPPAAPESSSVWEVLVHPGQKLKAGSRVRFEGLQGGPIVHGEILQRRFYGRREIRLWTGDGSPVDAAIDAIGHVPLPPYIKRPDRTQDRERYQTVFARERGSVAAPTAGLHFNPGLLAALSARGVEVAEITLHVGYGTFQPVRVDRVEDHRVEAERYSISAATADAINRALDDGRRVVAVGTTTTRALESAALAGGGRIAAGSRETDLFIYPGFVFRVIRGLMTNFHLPQSSLLMLVSAFAARPSMDPGHPELAERDLVEGRKLILKAYEAAVAERYRFYSYGDAMLVL